MSFLEEMQRDIARGIEEDMPSVITIGGSEYPCSRSSTKSTRALVIGGFESDVDLRVVVRLNASANDGASTLADAGLPVHGNTVTVDGHDYMVEFVDNSNSAYLVLSLNDAQRK